MAGQTRKNKTGNQTRQTTFGIHWATLFLLLPFIFVWAVIAIPGKHFEFANPVSPQYHQHGWPMVHFERATCDSTMLPDSARIECDRILDANKQFDDSIFEDSSGGKSTLFFFNEGPASYPSTVPINLEVGIWKMGFYGDHPYWFAKKSWSHVGQHFRIRWKGLLVNLLIAGSFFGLFGWVANRRFCKRGLRVSMKELCVFTLLCGLGCAVYSTASILNGRLARLENLEVVKLYDPSAKSDAYPDFMVRLMGRNMLPMTQHFRSLVVDFRKATPRERRIFQSGFSDLEHIEVAKLTGMDREIGTFLGHANNLEELTLVGPSELDEHWSALAKMEALKVLRVSSALDGTRIRIGREFFDSIKELPLLAELELEACDFDSADAKSLGQMAALKRLSIKDRPVDDELVEVLKTIGPMTYANLWGGGISNDQYDSLQKSKPKLVVVR